MALFLLASLVLLSPVLPGQIAAGPANAVGEFSNMRYTGEHAFGYSVQLWRQGNTLFGLFLASEGLIGDTPAGILEDVKFDPPTGMLSFKSRLSIGVRVLSPARQVSSRDLFVFRGTLAKTSMAGALTRLDMLQPRTRPIVRRVRLRRRESGSMMKPPNYAEWKKSADEILKFRGPKW